MLNNEHVKERLGRLTTLGIYELQELVTQLKYNQITIADGFNSRWWAVKDVTPEEALLLMPQAKDELEHLVAIRA